MDRKAVITEILDELSSHNPAKSMRTMRHWPGGALSIVHLNVLFILESDGPLPMRALADAMDVSQASATGIVDRMAQRGLVERLRDDADRRVVRVAITGEGRRLIESMAQERREHLGLLLEQLTDEELGASLTSARALRVARERLHPQLHAHAQAHRGGRCTGAGGGTSTAGTSSGPAGASSGAAGATRGELPPATPPERDHPPTPTPEDPAR